MTGTKESIRARAFGPGLQNLPSFFLKKNEKNYVEDGNFERGNSVKKSLKDANVTHQTHFGAD